MIARPWTYASADLRPGVDLALADRVLARALGAEVVAVVGLPAIADDRNVHSTATVKLSGRSRTARVHSSRSSSEPL